MGLLPGGQSSSYNPGAEAAPPPFFFSSDNSQFCSTTPEETHFTNMKINRKVYLRIQIQYLCIAPK